MKIVALIKLQILVILIIGSVAGIYGQDSEGTKLGSDSILISSLNWRNGDEANVHIHRIMLEIFNRPNSRGYIIIYCGKKCIYGEPEAHDRGIHQALALRGYNADLVTVVFGGFREETTTEFWLVPERGCPPKLSPTLGTDKIRFVRSTKKVLRPYDCCW